MFHLANIDLFSHYLTFFFWWWLEKHVKVKEQNKKKNIFFFQTVLYHSLTSQLKILKGFTWSLHSPVIFESCGIPFSSLLVEFYCGDRHKHIDLTFFFKKNHHGEMMEFMFYVHKFSAQVFFSLVELIVSICCPLWKNKFNSVTELSKLKL